MTDHLTQSAAAAASCNPPAGRGSSLPTLWRRSCSSGGILRGLRRCAHANGCRSSEQPDELAAPIEITRSIQTEADQDTVVVARPCANCGGVSGRTVIARPAAPRRRRSETTTPSSQHHGLPRAATVAYGITVMRTPRLSRPRRHRVPVRYSWYAMECPRLSTPI